jgi:hypothetical protein
MLASVINSERAIQVNIQIVRIYNKMRELLNENNEILLVIEKIKNQIADHDNKILLVFKYLKQFEKSKKQLSEQNLRPRIGFKS